MVTTRPLKSAERFILQQLATKLDLPVRAQLLEDLERATAELINPDGSILRFHIRGYERPVYEGSLLFPVEATAKDIDGADLGILLHGDGNGRLFELEIIRWGPGELREPRLDSLAVF